MGDRHDARRRGELITERAPDFADALPDGGVLLGLDLGTKTIGTAFCDAGWRFATNGKTLPRGKWARDREALSALIAQRHVKGIVLGLPRNMNASEGPRTQASRAFARNIAEAFTLPVLLWDERWSTLSAEAAMIGQDVSRSRRAASIDSHAAAIILQGAIDRLAGGVI
ncbi:MAG: Holliday junction resolvase RuvX [Erythrobacter sp.]